MNVLNLRKIAKLLYKVLTTSAEMLSNSSDNCIYHCNTKILNLFHLELQMIKTKPEFKNKLTGLLTELKKFKFQAVLVLDCKKKTSNLSFKQHLNEAFKKMKRLKKIKNDALQDYIVLHAIIKYSIMILSVSMRRKNGYNK